MNGPGIRMTLGAAGAIGGTTVGVENVRAATSEFHQLASIDPAQTIQGSDANLGGGSSSHIVAIVESAARNHLETALAQHEHIAIAAGTVALIGAGVFTWQVGRTLIDRFHARRDAAREKRMLKSLQPSARGAVTQVSDGYARSL